MIRKIKYWFRRKWSQIKRVIDFLPLIWKGYDWDYHYAIELFQHQLKRMADHMGSDKAWALENKQTSSRIRTAVELMDKVYNEEYGMEYYNVIEEKYGKTNFEFVETGDFDEKGDLDYGDDVSNMDNQELALYLGISEQEVKDDRDSAEEQARSLMNDPEQDF